MATIERAQEVLGSESDSEEDIRRAADSLNEYGEGAQRAEDSFWAIRFLMEAARLFRQIGDTKKAKKIDERIGEVEHTSS